MAARGCNARGNAQRSAPGAEAVPTMRAGVLFALLSLPCLSSAAGDVAAGGLWATGLSSLPEGHIAAPAGFAVTLGGFGCRPRACARSSTSARGRTGTAALSMVGKKMNINKDGNQRGPKPPRGGLGAPKAAPSSEALEQPRWGGTSEAYDDEVEVMSMMSGTDVDKPTDKVRVFGANLDSKVASRGQGLQDYEEEWSKALMEQELAKVGGDMEAAKRALRRRDQLIRDAETAFRTGVKLMERGKYKMAIDEIGRAINTTPGGAGSREGGQYTIWLGQALDANGQRGKAVQTMRALRSHEDRDVRKAAGGIEFILTSPALHLSKKNFQTFDIEKLDAIKGGKKALQYSKMEKMPEKYSLEWYMLQPPPPKKEEAASMGGVGMLAAVSAASGAALFFMSAVGSGS